MQSITISRPDDWHLHLRDGVYLSRTIQDSSRYFGRAIVMPNLVPPVINAENARAYFERITAHITATHFQPLMTLYLTDYTTPEIIHQAKQSGIVYACKLYPAGATTHSAAGVTDLTKLYSTLSAMETAGLPLLIHGEVVNKEVDIFDRETYFIDTVLESLIKQFPELKIVLEHITTHYAVDFVMSSPSTVGATITPHHLLLNRNDLLVGGIKPHYYCLPILKTQRDQQALVHAATSGNAKFFLGTDSAPHTQSKKECGCGCAGIYSAHAAIELYAEVFEKAGALNQLEKFASTNGATFYNLPLNHDTITLVKEPWQVPEVLSFGNEQLVPLYAGKMLQWRVIN